MSYPPPFPAEECETQNKWWSTLTIHAGSLVLHLCIARVKHHLFNMAAHTALDSQLGLPKTMGNAGSVAEGFIPRGFHSCQQFFSGEKVQWLH